MTPNYAPEPYGPSDPAVTVPENPTSIPMRDQVLFSPSPTLKTDTEPLKEKIQQKALLGLAQCARGYVACEKKETFEIGPNGEKILRGTVVTRKRVGPDLAAIQFILTNLNPAAWQLKPSAVSPPVEKEPDLSELSVQTLEELAGWIQKNAVEKKTAPNRLPAPDRHSYAEASQKEPSSAPSDFPTQKDTASFPSADLTHEKNERPHTSTDHRSIEPSAPENEGIKQAVSGRKSLCRTRKSSASALNTPSQPATSPCTLVPHVQRELPLFASPATNLSNKDETTIRLPSGHPGPMS